MPQVATRFPEPALNQQPKPRRPIPDDQLPVIVSAVRTPIGKFLGAFAEVPAPQLGGVAIAAALNRAGIKPEDVDEVFMGEVLTGGVGQNPARQAALKGGLPSTVSALTINKVCASGLKSVVLACQAIIAGDIEIAVAGGMENMSRAPYLLDRARTGYRLGHGQILDSMVHDGLWCAFNDFHMGETGELVSEYYGITRDEQDRYAAESHRKAVEAVKAGRFRSEIAPVTIPSRKGDLLVEGDEGPREDSTVDSLGKLKPAFKKEGTVTAGNASTINDGAAALVVMSQAKAKALGLKPLAKILDYYTAGLDPAWVMMTPVPAVRGMVGRNQGWKMSDFDLLEVNEAFSVQALAVNRELGLTDQQVNVNGGSVALGHPIGASGARILVTLVNALNQKGADRGIATLCLGGGNGVAMAVERMK